MVRVKICGITNLSDAQQAMQAGADAIGFIFYKKSPRYITPSKAKSIIAQIPPFITSVGVFVNEEAGTVKKTADFCSLGVIQLHGEETPAFCRKLKKFKIIKAFRVNGPIDLTALGRYQVDAFLFDACHENLFGGSGKLFNWAWIKSAKSLKTAIILSGGLNARNVKKAIKSVKPYAIDVCSGVELHPGKKSAHLIERLFREINSL